MQIKYPVVTFDTAAPAAESPFRAGMLGGEASDDDWHMVHHLDGEPRVGVQLSPNHVPAPPGGHYGRGCAGVRRVLTGMADEEHLENTIPEPGDADESFDVYRPVNPAMDGANATHVAHMRGNRDGFVDVLAGFVATGSDLSAPLRSPVEDVERIRFALEGLGPAHVESIDPM